MKRLTTILTITMLSGCATSPALQMSPEQVSMLSNAQLCELHNNYSPVSTTEVEIGRRNLNCDPAINECIGRGNKMGTPAMALCVQDLRQSWAMQRQLQQQDQQLQQQQTQMNNQRMWDNILEQSRPRKRQVIQGGNGTIIQEY